MQRSYEATPEKLEAVRDRVETMLNQTAAQLDTHPQIVALAMVLIVAERFGREGLEGLIETARGLRQVIIREERLARQGRQPHRGP